MDDTRRASRAGWRARLRRDRVSHWPPAQSVKVTELLGGLNRRQLTRSQREQIATLVEQGWDGPELRGEVARVIRGQVNE